MSKIIEFGPEARKKLVTGIDKLANAVTSTLGPNGRNVVITNQMVVLQLDNCKALQQHLFCLRCRQVLHLKDFEGSP